MNGVPSGIMKPFEYVTDREIIEEDKAFILKIMKLDPRDRSTEKELLQDGWFQLESEPNKHERFS